MNIDLKLGKLSEQIRNRNGEDIKRILEITAREARDLEETERIQLEVVKKISTQEHLKQLEIDHLAEDEREHLEEVKKRKDRRSELERLRAAARAVEMEEEEVVELRRKIAAGRPSITPQAQPSKNKRSSTQDDKFEDEKDWRRKEEDKLGRKTNPRRSPRGPHRTLESFTDDEEEPLRRSKMRRKEEDKLGRKTNSRRSPRGPHGTLETSTDDEEPLRRLKMRTRRELSGTPPHFEETEDQSTDEEESPPPKKNPKIARKPQIPPGSPPHEVDDLMAQFQGFGTPLGSSPHGSRSSSPMRYLPYGPPLPPSMAPVGHGYGYGGGVPGTIVNTGVGNITNSIISNVGNDNSVKKVYRK